MRPCSGEASLLKLGHARRQLDRSGAFPLLWVFLLCSLCVALFLGLVLLLLDVARSYMPSRRRFSSVSHDGQFLQTIFRVACSIWANSMSFASQTSCSSPPSRCSWPVRWPRKHGPHPWLVRLCVAWPTESSPYTGRRLPVR